MRSTAFSKPDATSRRCRGTQQGDGRVSARPLLGEQRVSGAPPNLKVRVCDTALLSQFETRPLQKSRQTGC